MFIKDCLGCAELTEKNTRLIKENRALWANLHMAKTELERLYINFGSRWPIAFMDDAENTIKELEKILIGYADGRMK